MDKGSSTYSCLALIGLFLFISSCRKEEPAKLPIVSTTPATGITVNTATSGGLITADGGATIIANGVCWSTNINPTTNDSKTADAISNGQFVSNLTDLNGGTTYHVRAYATNAVGTAYGADMSFSTLGLAPACLTQPATNISGTEANLNGTVNPNYLSTTVTFEYGATTSYGQTATPIQNPFTGNNIINVTVNISGLSPGTKYHYRIKTENSIGTTYGDDMTFTTFGSAPVAVTQAACCLSSTGATLYGSVNANYLSTIVTFEYGTTISYGNSVVSVPGTVTGNTSTNVSAVLSGLTSSTTYHYRIKAVNSIGTVYGGDMVFTTEPINHVNDIDGNTYQIVTIGNQIWMAENLKTTRFNDGTSIPNVTDASAWSALTTPGYCWYDNDGLNREIYGALYNWNTIDVTRNGGRNVCPNGWHVPTDAEWLVLINYLTNNGFGYGGSGSDIAKSIASTTMWSIDPIAGNVGNNQTSNNASGFNAAPGGIRPGNLLPFESLGLVAVWWTSTPYNENANVRYIRYDSNSVSGTVHLRTTGDAIRCVKN